MIVCIVTLFVREQLVLIICTISYQYYTNQYEYDIMCIITFNNIYNDCVYCDVVRSRAARPHYLYYIISILY